MTAYWQYIRSSPGSRCTSTKGGARIDWHELVLFTLLRVAHLFQVDRLLYGVVVSTHPFMAYFPGVERRPVVRRIFREHTDTVLRDLQVDFIWLGGYMGVNAANGHLIVNARYLRHGDRVDIYLDVIHELVHIKQLREGRDLFDRRYRYVERPTEVEAYRYAVDEARRLGLPDERICAYLRTEWMSDDAFAHLTKTLHVTCPHPRPF